MKDYFPRFPVASRALTCVLALRKDWARKSGSGGKTPIKAVRVKIIPSPIQRSPLLIEGLTHVTALEIELRWAKLYYSALDIKLGKQKQLRRVGSS